MGLSATDYFNGYTFRPADVLDALADLEIDVVATIASGERERLGPVPDNVRVAHYVPLHVLAPTCAAAIHHGGFGTLLTFAQYAVPQLALPYHFEGPLLSARLAEQGAGLALHSDDVTGPRVRAQLLRLLHEPTFREHATRLREEIDALPTPNQLVAQIEELGASRRAG
jgi:UDP:flavonoid glycosyltransferase YjiC (YdhE family)